MIFDSPTLNITFSPCWTSKIKKMKTQKFLDAFRSGKINTTTTQCFLHFHQVHNFFFFFILVIVHFFSFVRLAALYQ